MADRYLSSSVRPRADPLARRQQQLERPAVVHALAEIARPVGVGVDQAGMHQPVPGIDHRGAGGRGEAGPADLGDGVALDQDVGGRGLALGDVQKLAAADDGVGMLGLAGHGR